MYWAEPPLGVEVPGTVTERKARAKARAEFVLAFQANRARRHNVEDGRDAITAGDDAEDDQRWPARAGEPSGAEEDEEDDPGKRDEEGALLSLPSRPGKR